MEIKSWLKNIVITILLLAVATFLSVLMFQKTNSTNNVAIFYMLAVFLIAQNTSGYIPGIAASVIGVISVNLVFTYPYMELNFVLDGYQITFVAMLVMSCITSTLTTRLKRQSQIIYEREKMLMEAEKERMRANLLRAISHDLRTPLTSIIGTAGTYLEEGGGLTEDEKSRMVSNIYEDANWLLNIVENLLSVTRIREGDTKVVTTLEPMEEVISEAMVRFRKRIPEANVRITMPDEFIMIALDATLIEQVIINLLENAIYHSGSDKPIDFFIEVVGQEVWFHIRDYGKGIAPEYLEVIFDGNGSRDQDGSDSHKGMGIGLSICKTIITAHDGRIFVLNHEEGAEFVFILPVGERHSYDT